MTHDATPQPYTSSSAVIATTPAQRNHDRAQAIRALTGGEQVVYAARLPDGTVKIGCSGNLASRRRCIAPGAEILGFMPGDYDDEQAIHQTLKAHRARGWEYYHPTPAVLAVVKRDA